MSKTFIFQQTKQKLTVNKETFSLLQSWQEAVIMAFSDSLETISDLQNSLYSKLTNITLTKETVATAIANLHSLNKDEILRIHDSVLNKFYLNPNKAVLSGVCDMLARESGSSVMLSRISYIVFWFLSGGIGFWVYLGLSLILPTQENSLTNYLVKSILGENVDLEQKLDQRPTWVKKTDRVLDFISPIIFRSLCTILLLGSFVISIIYSYICSGLILQKIGFWPDVLWISTDIVDFEKAPTFVIILFFTSLLMVTLAGCYVLTKLIKEIRLPKINPKNIYKKVSLLGILLLIFVISQNIFKVQAPALAQKTFPIGEAREIAIIQNGFFCSTKYKVIIQKSDSNTVSLVGDAGRISGLTFDFQGEKEKAVVTNIYPFRTCFSEQKPEVTVIINTNKIGLKVIPHTLFTNNPDYTIHQTIVFGFKEGEIKFLDNPENVIFVK